MSKKNKKTQAPSTTQASIGLAPITTPGKVTVTPVPSKINQPQAFKIPAAQAVSVSNSSAQLCTEVVDGLSKDQARVVAVMLVCLRTGFAYSELARGIITKAKFPSGVSAIKRKHLFNVDGSGTVKTGLPSLPRAHTFQLGSFSEADLEAALHAKLGATWDSEAAERAQAALAAAQLVETKAS